MYEFLCTCYIYLILMDACTYVHFKLYLALEASHSAGIRQLHNIQLALTRGKFLTSHIDYCFTNLDRYKQTQYMVCI